MIEVAPLEEQALPASGRHLLATFDDTCVVVWQAHGAEVAREALANGRFGGPVWSTDRLSRMRLSLPSLLGRCDWGRRPGREHVLAVFLTREGLDAILRQAVHGVFEPAVYSSQASWRLATRYSNVSLSWYPDLDVLGRQLGRETPRLGLRDAALASWTDDWVVAVEDWTPWVETHRGAPPEDLALPVVRTYPLPDAARARLLGQGGVGVL